MDRRALLLCAMAIVTSPRSSLAATGAPAGYSVRTEDCVFSCEKGYSVRVNKTAPAPVLAGCKFKGACRWPRGDLTLHMFLDLTAFRVRQECASSIAGKPKAKRT